MITLGDEVKDTVSGFTGIAVAYSHTRFLVRPSTGESQWFEAAQLEVVKVAAVMP